jgi:hypothetical protein
MELWWADVRSGDGAYNPTKGAKKEFAVTTALVAKVLGSGEGDEVSEVQPVMCSLLATYFAAAWADTPWLHFFAERRTSDTPEATITSASKGTPVDFDLLRMHHDFSSNSLAVQRFKVTPTLPNADQLRRGRGKWTDAFAGSSRERAISLLKPIHQVIQHVVRIHSLAANCRLPVAVAHADAVDDRELVCAAAAVSCRCCRAGGYVHGLCRRRGADVCGRLHDQV